MNWQTALTRKSQPSGLPGWRRVISTPIPALGRPITAAITKLSAWSDSTLNGIAAAKDSTARAPRAMLQNLGDPRRKLMAGPYAPTVPGTLPQVLNLRGPAGPCGPRTGPRRPG